MAVPILHFTSEIEFIFFELINTDYCILQGTRIEEGTVTHSAICLL